MDLCAGECNAILWTEKTYIDGGVNIYVLQNTVIECDQHPTSDYISLFIQD